MTEYEMASLALQKTEVVQVQVQLIQAQAVLVGDTATTYITLLSGYLIVAYLLGGKLSKRDLTILNGLYVTFMFGSILSMSTAHGAGIRQYQRLLEMTSEPSIDVLWTQESMIISLSWLTLAALASLYFMWSIRHPKIE
jgi:hypothetical protein